MKDITIYTSTTCSFCHMAKDYLDGKNIKYTEKNISEDKDARMEMMKMGFTGVPVIYTKYVPFGAYFFYALRMAGPLRR